MSMDGKTVMVTGATNGIGEVTALELARMGARVIVVSRSESRCRDTVERIKRETGNEQVTYMTANLAEMNHVRQLAADFQERYDKLHVLVNNAGAFFLRRQLSPDGYEMTFALNHLNYFLLTTLLLDTLKATAVADGEARIVNVSSEAHRGVRIHFNDLERGTYYSYQVYGESKLMNIMFTYELAKRLEGTDVTVNALHPGFVRSGFGKSNNVLMNAAMTVAQLFAISPEEGAQTPIYLASSPEVKGVSGKYFVKKAPKRSSEASYNEQAWQQLWAVSESHVWPQETVLS